MSSRFVRLMLIATFVLVSGHAFAEHTVTVHNRTVTDHQRAPQIHVHAPATRSGR